MKILYLGSGPFAVPTLDCLCRRQADDPECNLLGVITRPDRPAGRGRKMAATPVRARALALELAVEAPPSVNDPAFLERLGELEPELFLVADYGEILGEDFLSIPRVGAFNLHASLLPRYRGAAPVAHALLNGDTVSGVTLFRIVRRLDSGPVVASVEVEIEPLETAGELESRLARKAAQLLDETLAEFLAGTFSETPQEESAASLAPKLRTSQGAIDWHRDATSIANHVRAMNPWPVAFSFLRRRHGDGSERIRILRARPGGGDEAAARGDAGPGEVVQAGDSLTVACETGVLEILQLQRPGRAPLEVREFLRGWPLRRGERFLAAEN